MSVKIKEKYKQKQRDKGKNKKNSTKKKRRDHEREATNQLHKIEKEREIIQKKSSNCKLYHFNFHHPIQIKCYQILLHGFICKEKRKKQNN